MGKRWLMLMLLLQLITGAFIIVRRCLLSLRDLSEFLLVQLDQLSVIRLVFEVLVLAIHVFVLNSKGFFFIHFFVFYQKLFLSLAMATVVAQMVKLPEQTLYQYHKCCIPSDKKLSVWKKKKLVIRKIGLFIPIFAGDSDRHIFYYFGSSEKNVSRQKNTFFLHFAKIDYTIV